MQATSGLEPDIGSINDISLAELTKIVKKSFEEWNSGRLPPVEFQLSPINQASSLSEAGAIPPSSGVTKH